MACQLIGTLRHPRVITPTVALERFYDHEVIMKVLCGMHIECGFIIHGLLELHRSIPCGIGTYNVVGGRCAPPH